MKQIFTILILALIALQTNAQQANDPKALLDEVAAKVESYDNIYIEFDHKLDNNEADVHQETRGHVTLEGELYHLNYMGTEQIFDGNKIYLIIHEDEEVIIQNSDEDNEDSLTPSKMFSFYKNGYTYAMGSLETIKGVKIQHVLLTPIDSDSEILNITIGVDIRTKHITNIVETGSNNTITTLEIRNFKTNQTISKQLFTCDVEKYRDQKNYTISEPN